MASLDSLRHVSLGQYYPGDSVIHRLDARAKIILVVVFTIAILLASSYVVNGALLVMMLGFLGVARLPWRQVLRMLKPLCFFFLIVALFQVLFSAASGGASSEEGLLIDWGSIALSANNLRVLVVSFVRLVNLILLVALLTGTTNTHALTRGLEYLLRPLDRVGLHGHELAMVGAVALRFLPILGEELETISRAQTARGVDLSVKRRWPVVSNARRTATLIVPLFADAFRRVDEMTMAMLARCYQGGRGRTHLEDPALRVRDCIALVTGAIILCAVMILRGSLLP